MVAFWLNLAAEAQSTLGAKGTAKAISVPSIVGVAQTFRSASKWKTSVGSDGNLQACTSGKLSAHLCPTLDHWCFVPESMNNLIGLLGTSTNGVFMYA